MLLTDFPADDDPGPNVPIRNSLCVIALALIGCGTDGPELANVTGTVTFDGQPVPDATVTFIPQEGQGSPSYGHTDVDGHYVMRFTLQKEGAMLGTHDVTIETQQYPPQELAELREAGVLTGDPVKIPGKYRNVGELTAQVERGNNEIPFALTSE